jgi:hypothetical protein
MPFSVCGDGGGGAQTEPSLAGLQPLDHRLLFVFDLKQGSRAAAAAAAVLLHLLQRVQLRRQPLRLQQTSVRLMRQKKCTPNLLLLLRYLLLHLAHFLLARLCRGVVNSHASQHRRCERRPHLSPPRSCCGSPAPSASALQPRPRSKAGVTTIETGSGSGGARSPWTWCR